MKRREKRCPYCERVLSVSEFYRNPRTDNLSAYCQECTIKVRRQSYRLNPSRGKQRAREQYYIEKFFREHPTHWIARIFIKCAQCHRRKFVIFFNGPHGIFCDKCLEKT